MVNFEKAIKLLRSGKKVIRPSWAEGSYWILGIDESICWGKDNKPAHIHLNQIDAKDFEVYDERAKTLGTIKSMVAAINKLANDLQIKETKPRRKKQLAPK